MKARPTSRVHTNYGQLIIPQLLNLGPANLGSSAALTSHPVTSKRHCLCPVSDRSTLIADIHTIVAVVN